MKKLYLSGIILIILFLSGKSFSQSAVYFCYETGSIGYAYGYSADIVKSKAYDACLTYGGIKPVLIDFTSEKGFGAVAMGTNAKGERVIGVGMGFKDMNGAKKTALEQCKKNGSQDAYITDSWNDE